MKFRNWILGAALAAIQPCMFGAMNSSYDDQSSMQQNQQPQMGNAEPFEGIDLNAGVGYSGVTLKGTRSGTKPLSTTYYGGDGVAVQVKVGGNYAFADMWLVGLEGYGQYNSAETKNRFFETATSTTATVRNFKMEWNLGLDVRLGFAPVQNNLIFVYAGPDWGYWDFVYNTPGLTSSYKDWRVGGLAGAGFEQKICDNWFVRSTFDYRWYGKKTLTYPNGETQTLEPRMATALFMIGYVF